ncbi:MAG: redoxin domain-containing protein [Candidatus Marinimicrobia bacterium]|nr:redoxin domain-containing protein [Candidatus Neomarinimicrobiota bacterium]
MKKESRPTLGKTGLEDLLPVGGQLGNRAPEFTGLTNWINSESLTMEGLQGQVVLVEFWTYTCINCINTMPALKKWHAKYADAGLVIVGVHSPEFAFERDYDNVVEHTIKYGLEYPVAQDNDFATWKAFNNRYWPAEYLIDQHGVIRYRHFGEGAYAETENLIRKLLEETGADLSAIG